MSREEIEQHFQTAYRYESEQNYAMALNEYSSAIAKMEALIPTASPQEQDSLRCFYPFLVFEFKYVYSDIQLL